MIASVLAAIYSFAILSILHVPSASLLSVIAGVFDVIPVVGVFCATIPAMASALTVSPNVALLVGVLYVFYHLLETYFIVPKVFGGQLRLSMLAVLISCLVAGYVAGPLAIVFVLPIVASYPVIERIWLEPYLARDTVEKHEQMAEAAESKTAAAPPACAQRPHLLPNDLHQRPLLAVPIQLEVKDLFPRAKIQPPSGNRDHHLAPHDRSLQVRIRVVFPGAIVLVLRMRLLRRQFLQPHFIVVMQAALVVVDKHTGGDVHRIHQHQSLPHSAFPQTLFHLGSDIHESAALRKFKPEFFAKGFHDAFHIASVRRLPSSLHPSPSSSRDARSTLLPRLALDADPGPRPQPAGGAGRKRFLERNPGKAKHRQN